MHQTRDSNYNLEAMPLINPGYNNCAGTSIIMNTLNFDDFGECLKDKRAG